MARYIITIARLADELAPARRVMVECEARYTLCSDIPEWLKQEIDPHAQTLEVQPGREEE